mmetsp:Transcript_1086/g.2158  ORF Transcript_1086/g.2158 Transcript_1086/m.2158 type:complete len:229 (-) Transcript_1086:20-706(-)
MSAPPTTRATTPANPATTLVVNPRQKGNPILKFIRNVAWAYGETLADYMMSESAGCLFLSLRYHQLHPNYLARRLGELRHHFTLRVLLVLVDANEADKPLLEISQQAMRSDFTLLLAWSPQEAARYLETFKAYARKPADMIQGQNDRAFVTQLSEALTTIRPVNKTDVATLHATFGSLSSIMTASREQLSRCPGLGERKVARLLDAFDEPFIPRGAALSAATLGGEAE